MKSAVSSVVIMWVYCQGLTKKSVSFQLFSARSSQAEFHLSCVCVCVCVCVWRWVCVLMTSLMDKTVEIYPSWANNALMFKTSGSKSFQRHSQALLPNTVFLRRASLQARLLAHWAVRGTHLSREEWTSFGSSQVEKGKVDYGTQVLGKLLNKPQLLGKKV